MQIEQDDAVINEKNKSSKTVTIIAVLIAVTVIALIAIIFVIMSMRDNKLAVTIDGKRVNVTDDTFYFTQDRKNLCINKRCCTACWI